MPLEYGALRSSIERRLVRNHVLAVNPPAQAIEQEMCRQDMLHWFHWWAWTYNPKEAVHGTAHLPFDLFPRQVELVRWVEARIQASEDGLLEKSRDIGFTWLAGGIALHHWLYRPGFKTTFGSRKGEYVDRIGDPDCIFEKMRMVMRALPRWMLPRGFMTAKHDNSMLLLNPANENTIRGEAGDEMGRGGRSSLYFIDEAAFIDHADRVDASTTANTDCRIWGSSVNGTGNLFYRKRFGGSLRPEQIFRFHYTDDPRKTADWALKKRASTEVHIWASEYDIDYTASVEGITIPAKWVESAKVIRELLRQRGTPLEPLTRGEAGGDVGAGKAKSVLVPRFGPIVGLPTAWLAPDTIDTAHKMLECCAVATEARSDGTPCRVTTLRFDNVGVGQGVESALKRRTPLAGTAAVLQIVPTNVGVPPSQRVWPDRETSEEKFANMKAEAWWVMRERFKATHEMVLALRGEEGGITHPIPDLIALPPDTDGPQAMALSGELSLVKWGRNERGKIAIETKQALSTRGVASPDYADALALTFTSSSQAERLKKAFGVAA